MGENIGKMYSVMNMWLFTTSTYPVVVQFEVLYQKMIVQLI